MNLYWSSLARLSYHLLPCAKPELRSCERLFNLSSTTDLTSQIFSSLHIFCIVQAPSPASHVWKTCEQASQSHNRHDHKSQKRLCQVCHLIVDGQSVRCQSCGLNAHPQCGSQYYPPNYNINPFGVPSSNNKLQLPISIAQIENYHKSKTHLDFIVYSKHRNCASTPKFPVPQNQEPNNTHRKPQFEPRIKKLLQLPGLREEEISIRQENRQHSSGCSSTPFSSTCGDSVAASTAIAVLVR